MYHLSRDSRRQANAAGLRKSYGLTRRCPHCGAELLWEQDEYGLYVAMDYDSDPHKPQRFDLPQPHAVGVMEQLSLAESLWEAGLDKCLYGPKRCPYRPCTAAQEVFCCRKCRHYGTCQSGCGKDGKNGKTTERVFVELQNRSNRKRGSRKY